MNKPASFLLLLVLASFSLTGCGARAGEQQMQQLVPEATRHRLTEKTYVFSRSQLKYGLQKIDYLSRWIDQPLFVDPTLDDGSGDTNPYPSFVKMARTAREYGLDGFAFFPQTSGRYRAYEYAERSNLSGFLLLNELTSGNPADTIDTAKRALDSSQSLRLNGKLVFTLFNADRRPLSYWQKMFSTLRAKYGDQFLFIPGVRRWAGQSGNYWEKKYHDNAITAADIASIKEYLRGWVRASDGLYYAAAASFQNEDHTFDGDFYRNFVIRLMKSVLAEPEFSQKYFGLSAAVGHENSTRVGVTLSSDATKTLRDSFETAMNAQPDFINIPEWDEQNENTSLRPTVYNGTSSMRIMRYYAAKLDNAGLAPLPADNREIPNLIISYRKLLVVGEKLEVELLNIPDTDKSTFYTAWLSLETLDGQTVYTAPEQHFSGDQMQDHTLVIPSETLARHEVLLPKLEIARDGHKSTFADGLHYIDLRGTWNWDYKWVKQPLRDVMPAAKVLFEMSPPDARGMRMVSADFQTDEPLARVQILDNDDVIYEYSSDDKWRENADHVVLRFQWQSLQNRKDGLRLTGGITLRNAQGKWLEADEGQTFSLDGKVAFSWPQQIFLSIPRAQAENAVLQMNIPGIYEGTIPVQQILNDTIYGIPGPRSFNLAISRYVRQDQMQQLLYTKSVHFTAPVLPDLPDSVLHLQAIGVSGKIYRSKPVALKPASAPMESATVFSDTTQSAIQTELQAARVPDIRYIFNPQHGSVLMTDAGRPFWAVLGGNFGLATGRGGGESKDATPFIRFERDYPADATQSAPLWMKLNDGEYALQFDGKGTYIALPQGVIPRRAGFTITMDIKPDSSEGKQLIIANRNYYPGSIAVYTEDGILKADFAGPNSSRHGMNSGLVLPAGKWSHLTICYDQQKITFAVDGKTGKTLAAKGPGLYDTASVVGGFGKDWFKGEIKSLRIQHQSITK